MSNNVRNYKKIIILWSGPFNGGVVDVVHDKHLLDHVRLGDLVFAKLQVHLRMDELANEWIIEWIKQYGIYEYINYWLY